MKKNQRQIQKEQTRRNLLAIAFNEFASRGIMSTRMSDVAEAAGVSHGTVFVHFASQEALITAVIEEFGENITHRTHELSSQCRGVQELLAAHLTSIMEFEAFYTRLVIEARLLPPMARDTFVMIQSAVSLHISQSAQREMEAGTIAPMPLHLFFNTWVGLIHYYITNSDLFAPESSVVERYGPMLLEHYMNLIKTFK
ncbi:MAG TPA: TetR/AcrR family transcriptional regulator [Syntrophomonadaceae bacterium]|nr:TetR/AcrR family transcriptional regulator [Syntrophomonadaceae bacterium]